MLGSPVRAVAVISYHSSPLGELGRGENGGMNLAIRRLCQELSAAGVPTDVFVRRDDPEAAAEELIAPTSRQIRLSAGPERGIPKGEARGHVDEFARRVVEHALSERRRYRLVHGHHWLGGLVAERLRGRWGVPWVQSFHTLALTKAEAGVAAEPGRAEAERRLAHAADRVTAASRSEAGDLLRLYGVMPPALARVRPGVDVVPPPGQAVERLRSSLGLEGRRVILCAGRLEPLKGVDLLIEAMALLAERPHLADVLCVIAGDNSGDGSLAGGERASLERLAAARGIADRVRFVGAVGRDGLMEHHALADVCAVPSRTESFGLVALEAQAMGTPVVATAVGGLTEIVEDGVTGLLVRDRQPHRFARALEQLLTDAPLRMRMGLAARARAGTFAWADAGQQLLEIYEGLGRRDRDAEEAEAGDRTVGATAELSGNVRGSGPARSQGAVAVLGEDPPRRRGQLRCQQSVGGSHDAVLD